VQKDLGKGLPFEVTASEINLGSYCPFGLNDGLMGMLAVLTEIEENLKHLDLWASPTAVYTNCTVPHFVPSVRSFIDALQWALNRPRHLCTTIPRAWSSSCRLGTIPSTLRLYPLLAPLQLATVPC
jgi:hypothetical protein